MMIDSILGRYLSLRFFKTIMTVFAGIVGMVYVFDFVEMLRRCNGMQGVTAGFVAVLSLLRTPSVAEQILPFCVLFGTMMAFLDLTRKLELIVARAAGVSVWQFLVPPVGIALLIGILSVTLFNPLSAVMKQHADAIETRLFGRSGQDKGDTTLWIRQKSVDGEAILRAAHASGAGTQLTSVTAYVYEPDGRFEERVEAKHAVLLPGVWELENAEISTPGEEARQVNTYMLATDLSPDRLGENFLTPDSVPFWSLPRLREESDTAGLDSTGFRLQYQTLLARPLLLVAMVLIAAAFSLRFFRFGGIGQMVGGGLGAGFVLYLLTKMVADLGGSGVLSTPVAAWSPAVVGSLLGALALLNTEDG
ncbi:MAG TPA: LPS export ABC transporter permease LptG [Methylovirgula sp.]|nr:LPS export ABC transporter permease LptG [Methylovirgula sp.]